jgi:hypothetical protein
MLLWYHRTQHSDTAAALPVVATDARELFGDCGRTLRALRPYARLESLPIKNTTKLPIARSHPPNPTQHPVGRASTPVNHLPACPDWLTDLDAHQTRIPETITPWASLMPSLTCASLQLYAPCCTISRIDGWNQNSGCRGNSDESDPIQLQWSLLVLSPLIWQERVSLVHTPHTVLCNDWHPGSADSLSQAV